MTPIRLPLFFTAWRASISEGLTPKSLLTDTISGVVVGAVSLPLSVAFAISAGL
jgi:MFS superfamily sulfate permease-like transporter